MVFKLSNLNLNLALTLGYLNPTLNNLAQEYTVFGFFSSKLGRQALGRNWGKLNQTLVLRNTAIDHAWIPDTYCGNIRQSNLKTSASDTEAAMRIDINGSVFLTQRFVKTAHLTLP